MKRAVESADGRAERVMIDVERFGGNRVLDRDIDRREFEVFVATGRTIHVAIHRNVFIKTP